MGNKCVKNRESNIEVLRIIAMFFVLLGHVLMITGGLPTVETFRTAPIHSSLRFCLTSIVCVGVNVFVLISGWFGIRFSLKGLGKFIFQFLFLTLLILVLCLLFNQTNIDIDIIKATLGIYNGYWFVMAYIGLYLSAPFLNMFVENSTKEQLQITLLLLYIFQSYYSWLTGYVDYFEGYSIPFFCCLYLTARYMRLYPIHWVCKIPALLYLSLLLIQTSICVYSWTHFGFAARMIRYDSPLVILQGLSLLIFATKFKFTNRCVNWISSSCFAVYIIHLHPVVFREFKGFIVSLDFSYTSPIYYCMISLFLVIVFVLCVIIDKVRLLAWNTLVRWI